LLPDIGYRIIENRLGRRKERSIYHRYKPTTIGRKNGMAKKKDKKKDSKKKAAKKKASKAKDVKKKDKKKKDKKKKKKDKKKKK
jgi:hypothetical protein